MLKVSLHMVVHPLQLERCLPVVHFVKGLSFPLLATPCRYLNPTAWATDYPVAYRKMVDTYATYRLNPSTRTHAVITGT